MIPQLLLLLYIISFSDGVSRMVCTMQDDPLTTVSCNGAWGKWTSCPTANSTAAMFVAQLDAELKERKIMFPDFLREVMQNKMWTNMAAAMEWRKKQGLSVQQCVRFRMKSRSKRSVPEGLQPISYEDVMEQFIPGLHRVGASMNGTSNTTAVPPTVVGPAATPTTSTPYANLLEMMRTNMVQLINDSFGSIAPYVKNGPLTGVQADSVRYMMQQLSQQFGMMLGSTAAYLQNKPFTADLDFCNCSASGSHSNSGGNGNGNGGGNGGGTSVNGDDYELTKENSSKCIDATADGKPLMTCGLCVRQFQACSDKYAMWYDQKTESQVCQSFAPACHVATLADGTCNYQAYMPTVAPAAGKMTQASYDLMASKLKAKWMQMMGTTSPMVNCIKAASTCFCCCGDQSPQLVEGVFACGQPPAMTTASSQQSSPTPTPTATSATSPPTTQNPGCYGDYTFQPPGCSSNNCSYNNHWSSANGLVTLSIPAPIAPMQCTGVGVAPQNNLMNAAFMLSCMSSNKTLMFHQMAIVNGTATGLMMVPTTDSATYNAAMNTVTFVHPVVNNLTPTISLAQCVYLVYLVAGATMSNMTATFTATPSYSPKQICPLTCMSGGTPPPMTNPTTIGVTPPMNITTPAATTMPSNTTKPANVTTPMMANTTLPMANTTVPATTPNTTVAATTKPAVNTTVPAVNATVPAVNTTVPVPTTTKIPCPSGSYSTVKCTNGSIGCQYRVEWSVQAGSFVATITTNNIANDRWIAVGFNKKADMDGTEALVVILNANQSWTYADAQPDQDNQFLNPNSTNAIMQAVSYTNGVVVAKVMRPLVATPGPSGRPYNLATGSFYLFFPFSGGKFKNGNMQYHEQYPEISPLYSFAGC